MQTSSLPGSIGYISNFVEIFAWMMTISAYEALWDLLCPEVNPYAWGYDFWYHAYAKAHVPGHRMGIWSDIIFTHEQADGQRSDTTKIEDKWNAVMAQERHYKQYKNIPLSYYRKNLGLSNTSWNGAVTGYLHPCSTISKKGINDRY
jgi:hypothetical protein